ncbi:kinesin motor domain-containing protein [Artemisia annua]|uniref:Kinesin motor domain-containing protein n=1 Tax=Artemisia annua TaxID=35608 RepID=A0A2U1KBY4_ARTAN|nr:kinesin motor domain-containing protein [Artemisia annua]
MSVNSSFKTVNRTPFPKDQQPRKGLVSSHISRQKEMVDARLAGMEETAAGSETVLDGHVFSTEGITTYAKRKLQQYSLQAKNDEKKCTRKYEKAALTYHFEGQSVSYAFKVAWITGLGRGICDAPNRFSDNSLLPLTFYRLLPKVNTFQLKILCITIDARAKGRPGYFITF